MSDHTKDGNDLPLPLDTKDTSQTSRLPEDGEPGSANGTGSAQRKLTHPRIALFPSSLWSPTSLQQSQSAGLPTTSSWGNFQISSNDTDNSSVGHLPGLGITNGSNGSNIARALGGRIIGAKTSGPNLNFQYIHAEDRHSATQGHDLASSSVPVMTVQTDPLPQNPFFTARDNSASSSSGSSSSRRPVMDTPQTTTSTSGTHLSSDPAVSDGQQQLVRSGSTATLAQTTKSASEKVSIKPDVWTERQSARSLRRALQDPDADWEEAFEGSLDLLAAVNPEHFQMPLGVSSCVCVLLNHN